jgi:hypothetical protein
MLNGAGVAHIGCIFLAETLQLPYLVNTTVTVVPCCSPLSSRTCQP